MRVIPYREKVNAELPFLQLFDTSIILEGMGVLFYLCNIYLE